MSSQTSMFAPKHRVAQATVTVGNISALNKRTGDPNDLKLSITSNCYPSNTLAKFEADHVYSFRDKRRANRRGDFSNYSQTCDGVQHTETLFYSVSLIMIVCVCVCVRMHMYIMSSGSSDIPLHNKSVVRLTKPSLCGCGPGATKGILCLYQTAFSESCVWMVFFMKAQARCEAIWDFWGWAQS